MNAETTFEVQADYSLYPDLTLAINAKTPLVDDELKALQNLFKRFIPDAYVSEIILSENIYCLIIDFQAVDYEVGVRSLQNSLEELGRSPTQKIQKITIG